MLLAAVQHNMGDIQPLVKTLISESECTTMKTLVHGAPAITNQGTHAHTRAPQEHAHTHTLTDVCFLAAVECGVVIRTLQGGDDPAADLPGEERRWSRGGGALYSQSSRGDLC